jgi:hypothetical protein
MSSKRVHSIPERIQRMIENGELSPEQEAMAMNYHNPAPDLKKGLAGVSDVPAGPPLEFSLATPEDRIPVPKPTYSTLADATGTVASVENAVASSTIVQPQEALATLAPAGEKAATRSAERSGESLASVAGRKAGRIATAPWRGVKSIAGGIGSLFSGGGGGRTVSEAEVKRAEAALEKALAHTPANVEHAVEKSSGFVARLGGKGPAAFAAVGAATLGGLALSGMRETTTTVGAVGRNRELEAALSNRNDPTFAV